MARGVVRGLWGLYNTVSYHQRHLRTI